MLQKGPRPLPGAAVDRSPCRSTKTAAQRGQWSTYSFVHRKSLPRRSSRAQDAFLSWLWFLYKFYDIPLTQCLDFSNVETRSQALQVPLTSLPPQRCPLPEHIPHGNPCNDVIIRRHTDVRSHRVGEYGDALIAFILDRCHEGILD